jgi:hypothetical protein
LPIRDVRFHGEFWGQADPVDVVNPIDGAARARFDRCSSIFLNEKLSTKQTPPPWALQIRGNFTSGLMGGLGTFFHSYL